MPVVEQSIDIRAPMSAVFLVVTDPRRGPEWNPNIIDVQLLTGLPVQVGTSWRQTMNVGGRPARLICRIVAYDHPRRGLLEISGDYKAGVHTTCQEIEGGTRLTQRLEFELPGGALGRMAGGLVGSVIRREMAQSLERQRAALEGQGGGPGGSGTT